MTYFSEKNYEDVVSPLEAMRLQEETGYRCDAYLYQQQPNLPSAHLPQDAASPVDADCRFKMAEWCYQVVDFCKFNRETVAIAMSYLDRFLSTATGRLILGDRKMFQLAAMTCLYTAVKIHEPEAMEPKIVAGLSRGAYTEQQVCDMEVSILQAIQWRMNPPTALSFAHSFFTLLDKDVLSETEKQAAFELAKFQTELAVHEYDFVTVPASTVALASVLNAIESVSVADAMEVRNILCKKVASLNMNGVPETQQKLFEIIGSNSSNTVRSSLVPKTPASKSFGAGGSVHVSPRCVASRQ